MSLVYQEDFETPFIWRCTVCYKTCQVTNGTMMAGLNPRQFDNLLTLWLSEARTITAGKILSRINSILNEHLR